MDKNKLLISTLKKNDLTLAIAESMTCGMATQKLSGIKDISDVLRGAVVCYTPEVKIELMGIKKSAIRKYTCESMEVSAALAQKLSTLISADIHAAITGLASPGGSESKAKPVGTVFLCILYKNKLHKRRKIFTGSPTEIKKKACMELYDFILTKI